MDDYDKIYSQDNPRTESGGWIQWKGTNVCMDGHCKCGADFHVDAEFCHMLRCPECKRVYAVGQNIKFIELTPEQYAEDDHIIDPENPDADIGGIG